MFLPILNCIIALIFLFASIAGSQPTIEEAERALLKAVTFFHSEVSRYGGYVWEYSGNLSLREGEGITTDTRIWVQPPGTPTVGEAFLDAYEATGDSMALNAARDAAHALCKGQMASGGWYYYIEFDPQKRMEHGYRDIVPHKKGKTTLDDDTSQSAVRFLMRLDKLLQFKEEKIHEAAIFALNSMIKAQYPNGGWYQWWERYPNPPDPEQYPVKKATFPETWSRVWLNDWTGVYFINDNVMGNMIATLLSAWETYDDAAYLNAAKKAGDFLILAQMPDPQPAWAQQYDRNMHPVWDRKFEPPAISGYESQGVMESLMLLYRKTGDRKYLDPIPRAIKYLRESRLPDGRLARFYELRTNRPLYFKRTGNRYDLTYNSNDLPTHYGFMIGSGLDEIEAEYQRLLQDSPAAPAPEIPNSKVNTVIEAMDDRGAWVEQSRLRYHKIEPESGIIACRTFVNNVRILCRFIAASKDSP